MDPQWLLERFGSQFFWVSAAIVFIECGLLFPILPGDSLLFAIGLFISTGDFSMNLVVALLVLSVAAFAGNVVGYEIGRALGRPLYERDGRFLKKKYFDQSHEFFEKHGAKALVIGRFVPIVRTFITVVAGVSRMERRHFFVWSGVGAVLWVWVITLLGYFLGNSFPALKDHLELAIMAIVAVSVIPMVVEVIRVRRGRSPIEVVVEETGEAVEDLRDDRV
jgi:membrane-associated protein